MTCGTTAWEMFTGKEFDQEGAPFAAVALDLRITNLDAIGVSSSEDKYVFIEFQDGAYKRVDMVADGNNTVYTKETFSIPANNKVENVRVRVGENDAGNCGIDWIDYQFDKPVLWPEIGQGEKLNITFNYPSGATAMTPGDFPVCPYTTTDKFLTNIETIDNSVAQGIGAYYFGARMFDASVGVWQTRDPVQQFWSPYKYASNPVSMVDPDGMFFGMGPVGVFLFFSDPGYDLQQQVSPVAVHANWHFGSEVSGAGFDISVGAPTASPISYRRHYGRTYYNSYYDNSLSGWVENSGGEWGTNIVGGVPITFSGTQYTGGGRDQVVHQLSGGVPFVSVKYANDGIEAMPIKDIGNALAKLPGVPTSLGDRWRTAALQVDAGVLGLPAGFNIGFNLVTGDPGALEIEDRPRELRDDGKMYYTAPAADEFRAGVAYVGAGPFKIGMNSEQIRHVLQNKWIHDSHGFPRYTVLSRGYEWFFYFGTGTGNTLW